MQLTKYKKNPILSPKPGSAWEKWAVCNPGAFYDNGKVYMLYRASGETDIYRIYLGLAVSEDGYNFKRASEQPIFTPINGFDSGCAEDPRIVKFGQYYYVTYACRANPYTAFVTGNKPEYPENAPLSLKQNLTRTGLLRTKDFYNYECLGAISRDDIDDRDVVIFPEKINGKYVMFHRPAEWVGQKYGTDKPGIWMCYSKDMIHWSNSELIAKPEFDWQSKKVGASTPPIKTKYGWLCMYHGVDDKRYYRQGFLMLDLKNPTKIIARPKDFVLEPTEKFEKEGVEHDVVFAVGNVVINGTYFAYYGGADKVICVATANMNELVDWVMSGK